MSVFAADRRAKSSVERAPRGSFEALYREEFDTVTAFFARRTREPQTVFDLTADTFVESMRSFRSAPPAEGSERAWLLTIARRVYAKHCERTAREREASRQERSGRVLEEDEIEELTERIDAERAGRELLLRLATLPVAELEAIELVDVAGLSTREVAEALSISPGALRVRLFRGRARLRKGVQDT
jgi:RNA polymerase sigma factor (sigma-70 family)